MRGTTWKFTVTQISTVTLLPMILVLPFTISETLDATMWLHFSFHLAFARVTKLLTSFIPMIRLTGREHVPNRF
jgi:hypothetical protein